MFCLLESTITLIEQKSLNIRWTEENIYVTIELNTCENEKKITVKMLIVYILEEWGIM